jgi:prophage regulatory protein
MSAYPEPEKILREPDVIDRVGLSRATLRRHEKAGNFPMRVTLGANSVGWLESEIKQYIATRAAKRKAVLAAAL